MGRIFIERRELGANVAITWDMTLHIYARDPAGVVLVVTENPSVVMPALRKQWLKLIRKLQNVMAGTLNADRRKEMLRRIKQMESAKFWVTEYNATASGAVILFVRPEDINLDLKNWNTTYILLQGSQEVLVKRISNAMSRHGLLVDYGRSVTDD
jgi:hypothetical protein